MKHFRNLSIALSTILLLGMDSGKQVEGFCGTRNTASKSGEQLGYTVYYSIIGIFVNAGTATINTTLDRLNNRPVYHVVGAGRSNSSYDWISKVNNRYESYIDTVTLQPLKFIRNVQEGNHRKHENITFNHRTNTAVTKDGVYKVPECVQDVVSALFYARNIDFSKHKPGDRITFSMFLDNEVYNMYLRYMGKEQIRTKYGRFRTIKLKPLLIKGTLFEGGEKMVAWVTDDLNKIPVRVESPLLVGSVKVDMMSYKNLRHPLSSLIKLR